MEKQVSSGLKTTFLVHLIVGLIFGLTFLLIPEVWASLISWSIKEPALYRMLGAALLGYTASSWWAYKETAWEKVKIVVQMEIVWAVLGTLAQVWGLLFAGLPTVIWLNAVILAAFAVAFGYFYFRK